MQISFDAYKTRLVADAGGASLSQAAAQAADTAGAQSLSGGDNVFFVPSLYPSRGAALSAVQGVLQGVDVVIDETFIPDPTAATEVCLDPRARSEHASAVLLRASVTPRASTFAEIASVIAPLATLRVM